MSNLARQSIKIPSHISVKLDGDVLSINGPLSKATINLCVLIFIDETKKKITVSDKLTSSSLDNKKLEGKALQGSTFALICQHILGISAGFRKQLNLVGVGYRASVESKEKSQILSLKLGYSHKIELEIPTNLKIICLKPTVISVYGQDKQKVYQMAAIIKSYKLPEPYKGKGILYQDEKILRKEGKRS